MFLFYLLGVGLPCGSIFCQFWLCEETQCVYLCCHLGSLLPVFFMPVIIRHWYECQELQGEYSVPYLNLTDYDGKNSSAHLKFLKLEIWEAEANGSLPLQLALGSVQESPHWMGEVRCQLRINLKKQK